MGKLEGKIALITGGNSGIGLATAKQFVNEGAYVFITGRRAPELAAAIKQIGRNVTGVQGDVSNLGDLDRLVAQIKREKDKLDIVFANAGVAKYAPLGEITEEHYDWIFNINPANIPTACLSADEQAVVEGVNTLLGEGSYYFREQATRPQTIGYGLADSPAGQLAWIYDKFHDWTDSHSDPENVLTKDEILDDAMLYWLPDTAASAARFYWENRDVTLNMGPVEKIPVACSIFPHEIYRAPRRWAEQTYKQLIYWNELERGGHFAALEQPEIFMNELRAAFHQPLFRAQLA